MIRIVLLSILCTSCTSVQRTYTQGAVAADHRLASEAGVRILKEGGNAVDAAVATSFTLSVVRPFSCGIGGGGFMLIKPANAPPVALNYRETAPEGVDPMYYKDHNSLIGPDAIGVPGTVAGLVEAHRNYGRLPLKQVMMPAIDIAQRGFRPDAAYRKGVEHAIRAFSRVSLELQNRVNCQARCPVDDQIVLRGQADVLRRIADEGTAGFYSGVVARAIVSSTEGHISLNDLKNYAPRWEQPLVVDVGDGVSIIAMPPPSSGGVAVGQILALMHRLNATTLSRTDPLYSHILVECMKHAFADRAEHLADPAFVEVPVDRLLSASYLDELASRVGKEQTAPSSTYGSSSQVPNDSGTSHFCVVDGDGMVVAATETINTAFGSQVTVSPFDFVLNNEMDDFSSPTGTNTYGLQQSERNLPEAGKRPLSSMSPTVVLRDGTPIFVVGASGGPRIISAVVQVLLNGVWFGDEPVDAITRPRLHHQWKPDQVYLEEVWNDTRVEESLREKGHTTTTRPTVGVVQAISIEGRNLKPASDPRKGGSASGIR
ncbi:MAG: gamma-glutamyltransferase [Phycisphaerales bacterium]|jgi:gamma-glutamyltranspeptidase/glutathione hydrolase|nr:gamma-glutamyltransferase [Phycisphaerales bacterium]